MKLPKSVVICEVGPRDGLQNEKIFIDTANKVELINRVSASGVKIIEVGSFVHPKAVPQMLNIDEVATKIERKPGVEYRALVMNRKGVERAIAAGMTKVKLTFSVTESHNLGNMNQSIAETQKNFAECVKVAHQQNVTVSGAMAVVFGCPYEGKVPVERIKTFTRNYLEMGITEISMADSGGVANPQQVYAVVSEMVNEFPKVVWTLHLHNTRGLALANILAAMQAGIYRFDSSFAGLGGCPYIPGASGNVATEDLVHMCQEMGVETGIDLDMAIETAKFASLLVGHKTESFVLHAGKSSSLIGSKPTGQVKIGERK